MNPRRTSLGDLGAYECYISEGRDAGGCTYREVKRGPVQSSSPVDLATRVHPVYPVYNLSHVNECPIYTLPWIYVKTADVDVFDCRAGTCRMRIWSVATIADTGGNESIKVTARDNVTALQRSRAFFFSRTKSTQNIKCKWKI